MGCGSSSLDFNTCKTVYEVLFQIECQIKKFKEIMTTLDSNSNEFKYYKKFVLKCSVILDSIKGRPLLYLEERLHKFKEIINEYYYSVINLNEEDYKKSSQELESFVYNMNDYLDGYRETTFKGSNNYKVNELLN